MKKILIVDDNANNRMVLSLLLQDYIDETGAEACEIEECVNGLEAFEKAVETKYDLIFMDIMMPKMDGIEATKKIREHDKDVMIIAVSAVDDDARQKEILRNGAEDYVPKPLDAEQLNARLDNYFSLLSKRHVPEKHANSKSANLYTDRIFHRQTIFYVESDEALSEFWEYYLLDEHPLMVDGLSDVIRLVYALGDAIVKLSEQPWIIVEADNDAIYFTLNKIDVIGEILVKLIMKKNKVTTEYKLNDEKVSFRLEKVISPIEEETAPPAEVHDTAVAVAAVEQKSVEVAKTNVEEYQVFDYLDSEDLLDMNELLGDLSSLMLMLGASPIEVEDIQQIGALLDALGRKLTIYTESFPIGKSLSDLSIEIFTNIDRFKEIENELSVMSGPFISDLKTWSRMTFEEGAPSADFMNDTIVANTKTFISMLNADESSADESDMDDIFDF